jgi:preprotein translocase subunit SecE
LATKKASSATSESAHVTRIQAKAAPKTAPSSKAAKQTTDTKKTTRRNPFRAIGGYFAGAWRELREVRWPTRSQTWGMTGALIGFTAVFVVLILLLDALFKYLFEIILK